MSRTQERILDAAEELFALQGIEATSLRSITTAAGVNSAAIHYHFGSKRLLVEAILTRRVAPLERARLARLDPLEAVYLEAPIPAESLAEAFLLPVVSSEAGRGAVRAGFDRLVAWLRFETESEAELAEVAAPVGNVAWRFARALCRGRALGQDEAESRFQLATGALVQYLRHERMRGDAASVASAASAGSEVMLDPGSDHRLAELLRFVSAGLDTPAAAAPFAFETDARRSDSRHAASRAVRLVDGTDRVASIADRIPLRRASGEGTSARQLTREVAEELTGEEGSPR